MLKLKHTVDHKAKEDINNNPTFPFVVLPQEEVKPEYKEITIKVGGLSQDAGLLEALNKAILDLHEKGEIDKGLISNGTSSFNDLYNQIKSLTLELPVKDNSGDLEERLNKLERVVGHLKVNSGLSFTHLLT